MKKALKITGIVLLFLIILILAAPFLFEKQIVNFVKKSINENLNATVAFHDADLSFIRNFPQASIKLDELSVINNAPFEGDTLVFAEHVNFNMSLKEIFKSGDEPKSISGFKLENAYVNIIVDSLGNSNYDIAIKEDAPVTEEEQQASAMSFDVEQYQIENSRLRYRDAGVGIDLLLEDLNHEGSGNFAQAVSTLSTTTSTVASVDFGGTKFLNKTGLTLDADLEMDLENMKFTFLENEARINQLPLHFNGFVQVNEDHNLVDVSFKTPSSSFKNFLAVMPEEYAKNIEGVETNGNFEIVGKVNGRIDEELIPKMEIKIASQNASFKYPDLPKSVRNIFIDTEIINTTGIMEDTYVAINNLAFQIDEDEFSAQGKIENLTENMLVNMMLNGTINLANIKQAYPLEMEQDLNGIFTANMNASFDMASIENEQYQNVKSSGNASLRNFTYEYETLPNQIAISEAKLNFQPSVVNLETMRATTGNSDMQLSGTINNLMGYLFTDQVLKANFDLKSNTFAVADFMTVETEEENENNTEASAETENTSTGEAFKLPDFLDINLDFAANEVLYDNLVLQNMKGTMAINDQTAHLQNVTTSLFDGNLGLQGAVSTKGDVPDFNMELDLNSLSFAKTMNNLELFQKLAPVARALDGILNLKLDLSGNLTNELTPNLQSLSGNALADILQAEVNPEESPLLAKLDNRLDFIDLENLNLKDIHSQFVFNNGAVEVKPFDFNIKEVKITASGTHDFNMDMNYTLNLDVPARYLGSDVTRLLSQLTAEQAQQMSVALPVGITGTYQSPNISVNTKQAVSELTSRIVDAQKENLKDKGKDLLNDLLGGDKNNTQQDSTQTEPDNQKEDVKEQVKDKVKDILGGFGKRDN